MTWSDSLEVIQQWEEWSGEQRKKLRSLGSHDNLWYLPYMIHMYWLQTCSILYTSLYSIIMRCGKNTANDPSSLSLSLSLSHSGFLACLRVSPWTIVWHLCWLRVSWTPSSRTETSKTLSENWELKSKNEPLNSNTYFLILFSFCFTPGPECNHAQVWVVINREISYQPWNIKLSTCYICLVAVTIATEISTPNSVRTESDRWSVGCQQAIVTTTKLVECWFRMQFYSQMRHFVEHAKPTSNIV